MIGRRLSHYEILEQIGAGGMGEVYRARDTTLGRDVAVKILPGDRAFRETARLRFQREATAASALNHPNIVTIHEINSADDVDFIVMEYVRGSTLSALMRTSTLTVPQIVGYCVQIADAVSRAHNAGVVHRDLKPGNVMVAEGGLVKVLDFGLAKFVYGADEAAQASTETLVTMPGVTTGTAAYMSPEQARGDAVDARSDIFSFGVLTFQLLARGELPFAGTNRMAMLHNLHFSQPRDLKSLCPEAPRQLVALVDRLLQKDRDKRVQTMAEVSSELRAIAAANHWSLTGEPVVPGGNYPGISRWAALLRFGARRRLLVVGILTIVALAAGLLLWIHRPHSSSFAASGEAPVEDQPYPLFKRARDDLDHHDRPGNIDHAIQLLDRAIALDPKSAASYATLSEAYSRKNGINPDPQWAKLASDYANRAVQLDDDLALAHISLGMVQMKNGQPGQAEKEYSKAVDLDPKSWRPYFALGVLYDHEGKRRQAADELQRALQLDPNNWQIYIELGLNAYLDANYKQAAAYWEQTLKVEPDNVEVLRDLGAVYHMLDRDDDAAAALQHALQIHPTADTYNNLGTIRFYQGRYQDAVSAFEKTVALGANTYDAWGNLGDAYRWSPGDKAKAKQAYTQAIQLVGEEIAKTPKDIGLRSQLATYLTKIGDKQNALKELKLVERAPNRDALTWFQSAIVYELCGERERALDALAAAVKAGQSLTDIKNEPELVSLRADPRYHLRILSAASSASTK